MKGKDSALHCRPPADILKRQCTILDWVPHFQHHRAQRILDPLATLSGSLSHYHTFSNKNPNRSLARSTKLSTRCHKSTWSSSSQFAQQTMHNTTTNNYQNYHTALMNNINRYGIQECNLQIRRAVEILEEVKIGKV